MREMEQSTKNTNIIILYVKVSLQLFRINTKIASFINSLQNFVKKVYDVEKYKATLHKIEIHLEKYWTCSTSWWEDNSKQH